MQWLPRVLVILAASSDLLTWTTESLLSELNVSEPTERTVLSDVLSQVTWKYHILRWSLVKPFPTNNNIKPSKQFFMIISNTHIVSLHAETNVQIDTSLDVMATSLLHVCKIWMRVWDGNLNSHVNMLLQNWRHYTLNNQLFLWSYNREIWSRCSILRKTYYSYDKRSWKNQKILNQNVSTWLFQFTMNSKSEMLFW